MRKTVFIVVVLFFQTYTSKAQSLLSFGKLWSNVEYGTSDGEGIRNSYYIKFSGDTLLNGKAYKNILRSDDSLHLDWNISGHIREDDSNRVYLYSGSNQDDLLMYDFNVSANDSIDTGQGYYVYVDSVNYQKISPSGELYKFIYINPFTIHIQGIGSLSGVLHGINDFLAVGINPFLVCFYRNDTLIYHNEKYSSCFLDVATTNGTFPTEQSLGKSIKVITEQEKVSLQFSDLNTSEARLLIYDLRGRFVFNYLLNGESQFNLSVERYNPGLYFYVFQNERQTITGKFIMLHFK